MGWGSRSTRSSSGGVFAPSCAGRWMHCQFASTRSTNPDPPVRHGCQHRPFDLAARPQLSPAAQGSPEVRAVPDRYLGLLAAVVEAWDKWEVLPVAAAGC